MSDVLIPVEQTAPAITVIVEDEATKEARKRRRAWLGCELLLARLTKHHANELKTEYRTVDVEITPAVSTIYSRPKLSPNEAGKDIHKAITLKSIVAAVADFYGQEPTHILSDRRDSEVVRARHAAFYLAKNLTHISFMAMERHFKKDHTTILVSARKFTERLKTDEALQVEVAALTRILGQAGPEE